MAGGYWVPVGLRWHPLTLKSQYCQVECPEVLVAKGEKEAMVEKKKKSYIHQFGNVT